MTAGYTVEVTPPSAVRPRRTGNMAVGGIALTSRGVPVLRIYGDRWVSMGDPETTWSGDPDIEIESLPPGTTITLRVTG